VELATAAKVIAMTALDFITDEKLVIQAKKDFETMMGGDKYICPLPADLKPMKR
jgi:aminobenzoyl-glutamate utilization protein B